MSYKEIAKSINPTRVGMNRQQEFILAGIMQANKPHACGDEPNGLRTMAALCFGNV